MGFINYLINGVSLGSVYAIIALGLHWDIPWFMVLPRC